MSKIARYFVLVLSLSTLVCLIACERALSGAEKAAVLASSEATTDNLFAGWSANDYATFSRDFDTDMQVEIPVSGFSTLKQDLDNKLGNYLSRRVYQVTQADEFYVVTYEARFEQQNPVKVTVAFHAAKPQSIAFLGFESEKASWSTFQQKR